VNEKEQIFISTHRSYPLSSLLISKMEDKLDNLEFYKFARYVVKNYSNIGKEEG
jgi:hypothetical protein